MVFSGHGFLSIWWNIKAGGIFLWPLIMKNCGIDKMFWKGLLNRQLGPQSKKWLTLKSIKREMNIKCFFSFVLDKI